ncbi:MAG: hypothetical protein K8T20_18655 [Planctomycetes bacterium]|nr:hypothetical protein [Planctomycetota bacterium]
MNRLLLAVATLAALPAFAGDAPNTAVDGLKKDVGAYGWRQIDSAKTVEVYRIEPDPTKAEGPNVVCGHKVISRGKDQGEAFAARIRTTLTEGQEAPTGKAKECKFQPGVLFRFVNGGDHADLLLCFSCDQFEIVATDPKAADASITMRDFDNYRAALVRLAQEALPDDKIVQGLVGWKWEPDAGAEKQVGKHGVKVLLAAEKVEVYRIKPKKGDPAAKERQIAGGYPVISQGPDLGPAFACRIATLLLKGRTQPGFDKECDFVPGVVFVVKSADDHADLVLCFSCDELQSIAYPKTAPDAITGQFDMDPVRAHWLELAKQALPADETIQKLEDKPK